MGGVGSGEKQPEDFLSPSAPERPVAPHPVPVDPEQASPCSLASASTGPAWLPGPRGQGAARQPWARPGEAARARKGRPSTPRWVWGGSWSPLSQPQPPAPPCSGPQLEGQPSHLLLFHTNPRTTHRLSHARWPPRPAPPPKSEPLRPRRGHCTEPPPPGGAERARAALRAGQRPQWPGAELCCALKMHTLSGPGRQRCTKEAGSELDRDSPASCPQRGLREHRQSRAPLSASSWQPPC